MRGKAPSRRRIGAAVRITPACAGKSTSDSAPASSLWDHPRVCGEKVCGRDHVSHCEGSPPRVRGKEKTSSCSLNVLGITPACAGKRGCDHQRQNRAEDHPRVCGEKKPASSTTAKRRGSPPRVRGKDTAQWILYEQVGITPACAGKSHCASERYFLDQDHPRVCGEKVALLLIRPDTRGSPPRVRGKD